MIKIFVQKDHHELEAQINDWLTDNSIIIISLSHSICNIDESIFHSIIINYKFDDTKPC